MNDFTVAGKFIAWIFSVMVTLGFLSQLKPLTYKMAELAMDAQKHQMSYGKFSRQLCSSGGHRKI